MPKGGLEVTSSISLANLNGALPEKNDKLTEYKYIPIVGARAIYGLRENFNAGANIDFPPISALVENI